MTAVEKLGIAFRQWQTDWDNFDKTGKNQPAPYDEFIAPFLEMEKQQIMNAYGIKTFRTIKMGLDVYEQINGEQYYNETYKSSKK